MGLPRTPICAVRHGVKSLMHNDLGWLQPVAKRVYFRTLPQSSNSLARKEKGPLVTNRDQRAVVDRSISLHDGTLYSEASGAGEMYGRN
jgi:hypothetical protein